MLSDLEAVERAILPAKVPETIFGVLVGDNAARLKLLDHLYKNLIRNIHPDKFHGDPAQPRANHVFMMLTVWKAEAARKIAAGTYGDNKPAPPPPDPIPVIEPQVIKTAKREYEVSRLITQGDLADLYACTYKEGKKEFNALFKLAQSPADNDLMENESRVLTAMYPSSQKEEKFFRYLPKPIDSFMLRGATRTNRRANVMQYASGYVTFADIIKAYPKGLNYKDVVWMFKRLLAGLGFAHNKHQVIHGAVIPTHVLVHPTEHGAKIIDWCYAVPEWKKGTGRIKALSSPYKSFYAPEVLAKKAPTPQTDLYMAAKCAVALLGGNIHTNQMPDEVPRPIQAFLGSCLLTAQNKRPDDAWKLHEDFDELLLRLVGKPRYRPLTMPATT